MRRVRLVRPGTPSPPDLPYKIELTLQRRTALCFSLIYLGRFPSLPPTIQCSGPQMAAEMRLLAALFPCKQRSQCPGKSTHRTSGVFLRAKRRTISTTEDEDCSLPAVTIGESSACPSERVRRRQFLKTRRLPDPNPGSRSDLADWHQIEQCEVFKVPASILDFGRYPDAARVPAPDPSLA